MTLLPSVKVEKQPEADQRLSSSPAATPATSGLAGGFLWAHVISDWSGLINQCRDWFGKLMSWDCTAALQAGRVQTIVLTWLSCETKMWLAAKPDAKVEHHQFVANKDLNQSLIIGSLKYQ